MEPSPCSGPPELCAIKTSFLRQQINTGGGKMYLVGEVKGKQLGLVTLWVICSVEQAAGKNREILVPGAGSVQTSAMSREARSGVHAHLGSSYPTRTPSYCSHLVQSLCIGTSHRSQVLSSNFHGRYLQCLKRM